MLPQVGREFLVRIRFSWRRVFKGQYLLLANTAAAGGMLALGDILQQSWEIHTKPGQVRDWKRTGCMLVVGLSLGPPLHYWYGWLERVHAGNTLSAVSKKVLVDQLVASPMAGIWYLLGMNLMEGHTLSEGWEELKDKFWEFYKADWCVWPAVQMINFYFVPPKYRVLYISTVSLGWDVYLSYLKNRNDRHPTAMVSDSSAADVQQKALLPPELLEEKA